MNTLIQGNEVQKLDMQEATKTVLEECRMVLPGIQALFGFQLIAVFNQPFSKLLSGGEQVAHCVALAMSALAIALVMAPAAYHRQVHPQSVSKMHLRASSWFLTLGMLPLMVALLIDVYLVTRIITTHVSAAVVVTTILAAVFSFLWIIFPRAMRSTRKATMV